MKTEPTEAYEHLRSWWFEELEDDYCTTDSANEAIKIAFQEGQSSPKIKQLEWVLESGGWYISMTRARFGVSYEIEYSKKHGGFILYDILLNTTIHDTLDEAKAAAQADFERRIKECLDL